MPPRPTRPSQPKCQPCTKPKVVEYMVESDARNRLANHVIIGLHGILSIVQDYAKGGVQFDTNQLQRAIRRLEGVISDQEFKQLVEETAKEHQAEMEQEWLNRDPSGRVQTEDSGVT